MAENALGYPNMFRILDRRRGRRAISKPMKANDTSELGFGQLHHAEVDRDLGHGRAVLRDPESAGPSNTSFVPTPNTTRKQRPVDLQVAFQRRDKRGGELYLDWLMGLRLIRLETKPPIRAPAHQVAVNLDRR